MENGLKGGKSGGCLYNLSEMWGWFELSGNEVGEKGEVLRIFLE